MKRGIFIACGLAAVLAAVPMRATTFAVLNGDVTGLINAINACNSNGQDDTIFLAAGGTYTLTSALPMLGADSGHSLTIRGNGTTIQRSSAGGTPNFRIFITRSGSNVTLSGLTIANGNPGAFHGGAIYANWDESAATTLTIVNCVFSGNSGDYGGAIFNDGYNDASLPPHTSTLEVMNSTFINNAAIQHGGAIWNESGGIVMDVSNSAFTQNSSAGDAGAIQFDGSTGTATGSISNCAFSHNSAGGVGGAISVDGQGGTDSNGSPTSGSAILPVINCTFDSNTAGSGGGIALEGSIRLGTAGNATVKVDSCTFSGNTASGVGGGIYLTQTGAGTTSLQIGNTILKAGATGANLAIANSGGGTAAVSSQGFNLSSDAAGGGAGTTPAGFLNHSGDQRNTDPLLDPSGLKNNGGPTATIALQAGSPAFDQGSSNTILHPTTDQRGYPRTFDDPNIANATGGDGTDIGAYEADVRAVSSGHAGVGGVDFVINFSTILGHTYELQSRPSLTSGTWTNVANTVPPPPISGTGGIVQVTVPNASSFSTAFYQLIQLP